MASPRDLNIYSIAAHRGFADALVAGLVPRYREPGLGLARLTVLLPSARAARTLSEAFVRHAGEKGDAGLLMPRMAMVGDLDLDETLGALMDPLGSSDIPPAVDPTRRWLELASILRTAREAQGEEPLGQAALLNQARELAGTIDRLLVEGIEPDDLFDEKVIALQPELADHWQKSTRVFATAFKLWHAWLAEKGLIDASRRRNLLFERAAQRWKAEPPATPIVAAGVTSTAPALARLLRVVAGMEKGAVILPDLDLAMPEEAWDELGRAGAPAQGDGRVYASGDAVTHPQYHLKLLLNRMGIAREEVQPWHRRGIAAADPQRSHAVSSLFLPPRASRSWADLPPEKRRLAGLRLIDAATGEEEAQAIALLIRESLEQPEKRVALVTPDRALARRVSQHLARWHIVADDTAGRPLDLTPAGRFALLLAEIMADGPLPIPLVAALGHPLVRRDADRRAWLVSLRAFERKLRGPRPAPGLAALITTAAKAGVEDWWSEVERALGSLLESARSSVRLDVALGQIIESGECLASEALWSGEDGRALAEFLEDLRGHAAEHGTEVDLAALPVILRDAMKSVAVRPPYGGHPRVAIYGLLESRMTRADLVICGGLVEGTWPAIPAADPLLAPAMLRTLGIPAADFRIGLAAHDLASAMGAPEVVMTHALRDADGPTIPSRFLMRVEAMLGEQADAHRQPNLTRMANALDRKVDAAERATRPMPDPSSDQRKVDVRVTALDRLLGDPYQFYAQSILALKVLDPLDGDVTADPAWKGTLAHRMIDEWHRRLAAEPELSITQVARELLTRENAHPLLRGLWLPRLVEGLSWIEQTVRAGDGRTIIGTELDGEMQVSGVRVHGRADRIDRMPDGTLAIVDYKTGKPPGAAQVEAGFALQLGLLGLIARDGAFETPDRGQISGDARRFEYWSLAKGRDGFGYIEQPYISPDNRKRSGLELENFLPCHEQYLLEAISDYIKGRKPFTAKLRPDYPGYNDYDQLMRLDEWQIDLADDKQDQQP